MKSEVNLVQVLQKEVTLREEARFIAIDIELCMVIADALRNRRTLYKI